MAKEKKIELKICPICKNSIDKSTAVNYKRRYYCEDCYEIKLERERAEESEVHEKALSRQLTDWLMVQYDITKLSTYFCTKLQKIYNGTAPNMSKPIPCEDLFYMWKHKLDELDAIAEENRKKGNEIVGEGRLNYDLAVLIGKYDRYLIWKNKQKIEQMDKSEIEENIKSSQETIEFISKINTKPVNRKINKDNIIDLNDILDEI